MKLNSILVALKELPLSDCLPQNDYVFFVLNNNANSILKYSTFVSDFLYNQIENTIDYWIQ
jgi:hypothetical protein